MISAKQMSQLLRKKACNTSVCGNGLANGNGDSGREAKAKPNWILYSFAITVRKYP